MMIGGLLVCLAALASASPPCAPSTALPIVDLGTSVTQAILNTSNGGTYSFKNIPYAKPPVGNLRFRAPQPLTAINRTVNTGASPRVCAQAGSPWFEFSIPLLVQTIAEAGITPVPVVAPTPTDQSEDCLLLDVVVPKTVFDARATKLAPVLLWIHGGGYIQGSKDEENPATLVSQSLDGGKQGIVYVAINYRLYVVPEAEKVAFDGLFGFPPRPAGDNSNDITPNAGLYDQRLAMDWVVHNIRAFGGDPAAITVIGESAGAGSIVSHLSAYGGVDGSLPFKRAIVQSPAIKPAQDAALLAQIFEQLLTTANATSIAAVRQLSTDQLQGVNAAMIAAGPFASTVFGPSIDGTYIPDYPGNLLVEGKVDHAVQVLVAHNLAEGLIFTDPRITNDTGFAAYLAGFLPSVPATKITQFVTDIYPADFSGTTLPYTTQTQRVTLAIGEGLIDCFAFGTGLAYGNTTHDYQFSLFPGIHAQDTSYTFWNGETTDTLGIPVDLTVAQTMQAWITDFASGTLFTSSNTPATTVLPALYGTGANTVDITSAGFATIRDPAANSRCQFWLTGLTA